MATQNDWHWSQRIWCIFSGPVVLPTCVLHLLSVKRTSYYIANLPTVLSWSLVIIYFLWWKDGVTVLFENLIKPMDICPSTTQMLTILAPVLEISCTSTPSLIHRYPYKTKLSFSSVFLQCCLSNQINCLKIATRSYICVACSSALYTE